MKTSRIYLTIFLALLLLLSGCGLPEPGGQSASASVGTIPVMSMSASYKSLIKQFPENQKTTLYAPNYRDLREVAVHSPGDMTYVMAGDNALEPLLNLRGILAKLEKRSPENPPTGSRPGYGLLLINDSGTKFNYRLLEGGIDVEGSYYSLTEKEYSSLEKQFASIYKEGPAHAQWLYWLKASRVTGASVTKDGRNIPVTQDNVYWVASYARVFHVDKNSVKTYKGKQSLKDKDCQLTVTLEFDSGLTYRVMLAGKYLYVESSDKSTGCRYTVSDPDAIVDSMDSLNADMVNPSTGKPVIYLYPKSITTVNVKLQFDGDITYTYPTYNNGWTVTAQPDGTLRNLADDTLHYYLFWEGNVNKKDWDFSRGFVVKGEDTESFLVEKLSFMGLTPKEYNDFIVYWVPELEQNPYNLITFAGEEYEAVAPLTIVPKPDSMLRIHMVYKPLTAPVDVTPQNLTTFTRRGFTAVEWGGTRA